MKFFVCQVCGTKFSRKDQLIQHDTTHNVVRNYKCSICPEGRFFKTQDGLTRHMRFHYEPKFSRRFCEYKCHTTSDLHKHEKTHFKT